MINKQQLSEAFALNFSLIQRQCDGLTQDDSLLQPPFRGNCLNWVLGHILVGRDRVLRLLEDEPLLTTQQTALYETNSDPITRNTEGIVPLLTLLEWLQISQERIAIALQRPTSDEIPEGIAQRIFGLYFHDTYHTGQTELLRQLAGTNDKIV